MMSRWDSPNFLQCCVKPHHLHCNKRPRAGWACPGERGRASATAGKNRAVQPGRAGDTTNDTTQQQQPHWWSRQTAGTVHATYVCTLKHTEHLPHTSLGARLLLPLRLRLIGFLPPEMLVPLRIQDARYYEKRRMKRGDKERCKKETRGREGGLYEHWFTCVVGSSEYAFRHFGRRSMAHSKFLSPVPPFPWAVSMPWALGLNLTALWGHSKAFWHKLNFCMLVMCKAQWQTLQEKKDDSTYGEEEHRSWERNLVL